MMTLKDLPLPRREPDTGFPVALRPEPLLPPIQRSIFDDPGDEKSWHISQRAENLMHFYKDRKPSWYTAAIAPLRGADRVLDLGCGPGLSLKALRLQGSSSVLGVDRWPAFVQTDPLTPVLAHDLTLPMPFLESGSFDAVLSHYALYYISPIGVRQILREAHRVLAPGGRLVIYLAATGMGSGDEARTSVYSAGALRRLLLEAGFDEIDAETSSNGHNSVAQARRPSVEPVAVSDREPPHSRAQIDGETQLSVAFHDGGEKVGCELVGAGRRLALGFDLAPLEGSSGDSRVSMCLRAVPLVQSGTELHLWVWRGAELVASESLRCEFNALEVEVNNTGEVEHFSVWSPKELPIEPYGNAYVHLDELPAGVGLSEAARGAEGRQVAVESHHEGDIDIAYRLGPGRNRFLIRRAAALDFPAVDREWLAGHMAGIVFTADELEGEQMRELLLWAGWRQALIYLEGPDWGSVLATASRRESELSGPVVLVDPALSGGGPGQPVPREVADFAVVRGRFFVLMGARSRSNSASEDLRRLSGRLLHAGSGGDSDAEAQDANETLRYLTERTMLMRLRHASGRLPVEVGRKPVLRR